MAANTYSAQLTFAASSCGAAALPQPLVSFGFPVTDILIANSCGGRVYINPSGGLATTAMGYYSCGETRHLPGLLTQGLGLTTTSTSTVAAGSPTLSIIAWSQ